MVLGASLTSLGLSAGGIILFGSDASAMVVGGLEIVGVLSAFVSICLTEAWSSS